MKHELSVIVPVYYGEKSVGRLVAALQAELPKYVNSFEIVLVNDGSRDRSAAVCEELARQSPDQLTFVDLARNFSEHNAVMAGLNFCRGRYAVIIDDDFQNPPEEIYKLYRRIVDTDSDVVYSKYAKKKHHWFRNFGSAFNGYVATIMLDKPKDLYLSSFKIISRNIIDQIVLYKGPYPYIDGLILRATSHIETQEVRHETRAEGKSNYTLKKLLALWSNMFINFSIQPLRWALQLGFLFSTFGFILAVYFAVEKIRDSSVPLGWASLIVSVLMLSGVQLLVMGMIGEFLGRLYLTDTGKPQYVVRKVHAGESTRVGESRNVLDA